MKKIIGFILAVLFVFSISLKHAAAVDFPKTIDYPPMSEPNVNLGNPIEIANETELLNALKSSSDGSYYLTKNMNISSQGTIAITKSKKIDLNTFTITAGNSTIFNITSSYFSVENGTINGGNTASVGGDLSIAGLIYVPLATTYGNNIVIRDITHKSDGVFIKAMGSNIFFSGDNTITNGYQNARAGNVTFLDGKFVGKVINNGYSNDYGQAASIVNISFYGYGASNAYYPRDKFNQKTGSRRIYVTKNADVHLTNTNDTKVTTYLAYTNNIGNFSTLTIEGTLVGESRGTSLRTTAPTTTNTGEAYNTRADAGTYNNRANINILEGAKFKISSTADNATWGTIYTWATDVYAMNPEIFDMRYFGNGNFIRNNSAGDMILYNLDVGVWSKSSQGVGNPISLWQDITELSVIGARGTASGTVSAIPASYGINNTTFNVSNFSRISNDVTLPMIIPDDTFIKNGTTDQYIVNNGDSEFYGSTNYYYPDGSLANKDAVGATIELFSGKNLIDSVITDDNGNWSFDNFNSKKLKAGAYTLKMTDADKRTAKDVPVTVVDTLPPEATTKLYKFKLGTSNALTNPKGDSILSYSDETSEMSAISFKYQLSEQERKNIINTLGYYEVMVEVTDAAGNTNTVMAPVIVYEDVVPVTGFISGIDFEINYNTWVNATDSQKRELMINEIYGKLKGYQISGNTVTDITADATKLTATFTGHVWEPKKTFAIQTNVPGYSKIINVTLVPAEVKMNLKQVYEGTNKPIYSDLINNTPVDNSRTFDKKIGDSLEAMLQQMITAGDFKLNYNGYGTIDVKNFKVVINNTVVTPTPTVVPDVAFELIYEYQGEMRFDEVPNLEFGKIEVSGSDQLSILETSSSSNVKIINTLSGRNWQLKLSLPSGILNDRTDESFIGNLVYFESATNKQVVDNVGVVISNQKLTDKSLSVFDVRGASDTGMRLEQKIGNRKDKYSGDLLWSLEDIP